MNAPLWLKFQIHQFLWAFGYRTFRFPGAIYVYLTFRCNLQCSYCDNGSGRKFPDLSAVELSPAEWEKILQGMIRYSDVLLLSGGEPLVYPHTLEVIRIARRIGFKFISLNTNGLLLGDEITEAVDALIVSLDSLDREKSDKMWNRQGATDHVIKTIERLSRRRNPSLMVNSVILPDNIEDVEAVLNFCGRNGIAFSAGPALEKTYAVKGLRRNAKYRDLMEKILAAKMAGQRIAATVDYLKAVAKFRPFKCHPLLVWRIKPDGELVFPCSRKNSGAGNLIQNADPVQLFQMASGGNFFEVNCGENCPLSCYMDTSYMIQRPLGLLREGLYRLRTFSHGHRLIY